MKKMKIITVALMLSVPAVCNAWPSESSGYKNYEEFFNAGRTTTASANFNCSISMGDVWATGNTSLSYADQHGMYFNVCRDLQPPSPVTVMNATLQSDTSIKLVWTQVGDQEGGVWGYRVYRSYYNGPTKYESRLVDAPDNTSNSYTDMSDLIFGIQYAYEVRAVDGALNEQTAGNKRVLVNPVARLHSVTDLTATGVTGGDIALAWSAVSGATHYKIYRSTTFGERGTCLTPGTDVTQPAYLDDKTNLTGGTRYYYMAQAVVASVEETKGNNQASTISDKSGPNAPVIRSSTHPVQGQAYPNPNPAFTWLRSADPGMNSDVAGYYVKIDPSPATGTPVNGANWTFVTDPQESYQTLTNGVWYFHCRAKDLAGNLGDEAVYCINVLATGEIRGRLTDARTGNPMGGILAEAWLGNIKLEEDSTDAGGNYNFGNLPYGTYKIRFNRFGTKPLEKSGDLDLTTTPLTLDAAWQQEDVIAHNQAAAYPNPATGDEVRMIYYCEESCEVLIEIYDVLGQMVGRIREDKGAGYTYSAWPLKNVARGVYLFKVKMRMPNGRKVALPAKKFTVIK